MTRTQIQLPDPLHRNLKQLASERDWSLTEVIRRASEQYLQQNPIQRQESEEWGLMPPFDLGEEQVDVANYRFEAAAIQERIEG